MKNLICFFAATCLIASLCGCSQGNAPAIEGPLVMYGENVHEQRMDATTVTSAIKRIEKVKETPRGTALIFLLEDGKYYEVYVTHEELYWASYTVRDVFNKKYIFEGRISKEHDEYYWNPMMDELIGSKKDRHFPLEFCLIDKDRFYEAEKWLSENRAKTETGADWTTAEIVHTVSVYRPKYNDQITCLVYTDNGDRLYIDHNGIIAGYGKSGSVDLDEMTIEYKKNRNADGNLESVAVRRIE